MFAYNVLVSWYWTNVLRSRSAVTFFIVLEYISHTLHSLRDWSWAFLIRNKVWSSRQRFRGLYRIPQCYIHWLSDVMFLGNVKRCASFEFQASNVALFSGKSPDADCILLSSPGEGQIRMCDIQGRVRRILGFSAGDGHVVAMDCWSHFLAAVSALPYWFESVSIAPCALVLRIRAQCFWNDFLFLMDQIDSWILAEWRIP